MKSYVIEHMVVDLVAPELRKGLANMYMNKAFRFGKTMVRTKKVEVNINKPLLSSESVYDPLDPSAKIEINYSPFATVNS